MENVKRIEGKDKILSTTENSLEFNGFTLDEIRHYRALVAVRKEFAKAKIFEQVDALKDRNPFAPDGTLKAASRLGPIPMKIIKGLNYTDYIMLGISAFGTLKKVFSVFRKKKKK
ncbi:MAG: hypothetical protein K2N35_00275 [Muribaculaceae bacterium]|nr:hypothetical protein [Muribaculaceae bacterium]